MRTLTVLLFSLFISQSSFAFFAPACGQSYRWDSFGRGIKAAFLKGEYRSQYNDEGCFKAGYYYAVKIIKHDSSSFCLKSFERGLVEGFKYQLNTNIADKCYSAGHTAGVADLQIATREGNVALVGEKCIRAYQEGKRDYHRGVSSSWGSSYSDKVRHCYEQGLHEAPFMPR